MKECNFMLSLLLLLSERLACYGFTTEPAVPEGSDLLPSTVQVILGTSTTFVVLTSSDQDLKTATPLTETEFSATTEIYPTNGNGIEDLHPALIYGVPAAFVLVLLVLLIFFIIRRRKRKQLKQEELGSENCKSPIFEEDTPSVMEIEMEELDKWMNSLKKNAECEYLTPVKEEKDLNAKTSDCES
ncbi:transmembrane protein 154 isoform X2 [Sphaerodactylus townsendi]|uniref:transmembrane protein 154 isoform X2 n=1 Tax=Sphaerodactylus townsendi TaxID=933632 RepID=UPI002026C800|nr:transmembrane protein 154 isoform X2 [Sphaerodactylus townsendi]